MADSDLNLLISTTADLGGIRQLEAEITKIKAAIADQNTLAARQASLRADFPGIYGPGAKFAGLAEGGGVPFGPGAGGAGSAGLTSVAADMERTAAASLLVGANLARARNEAVTLMREMAAGAPTTRTWGALLGALGFQIAGIAAAVGGVPFVISKIIEQEQKLNDTINEGLSGVTELGKKWNEAARGVSGPEGVQKVAESVTTEVEKTNAAVTKSASTILPWWKRAIDSVLGISTWGGTPFQDAQDKMTAALSVTAEETRKVGASTIHVAEASEKAFDTSRVEGLLDKLHDLQEQQDALARGPTGAVLDPEHFTELGKKIDDVKAKLKELIALDEARLKVADAAAKKLSTDVQTPQADFQKKQQTEFRQHMEERHALQIKLNAARASGDDATARAIQEQLGQDTFRQDQAAEAGERELALRRDIYSTPGDESDQFSTPRGLPDRFTDPTSVLPGIYGQRAAARSAATGGRTDAGSEKIAKILTDIYRQWQ